MLADQSGWHAKCGPSEPFLGSHVSLGPGIWPFWGALGAISSVGGRFCLLGTQPTKKPFWPQLGATGDFSGMFWLIETAFALRNFRTVCIFDGSASCDRNSQFARFWGFSAPREIPFGTLNGLKTPPKRTFPPLGAVVGETLTDQMSLRGQYGPNEHCLGSQLGLPLFLIRFRFRVTELKYVVL